MNYNHPPVIEAIVAWIYDDREGNTRIMHAIIPPGSLFQLMCVEGDPNEVGMDTIARRYARSGRVDARKVRFVPDGEPLEEVRGAPTGGGDE